MTELLRFATAGSVDDGKSTLIGRLLFDSKQIFQDQWDSVERVSRERGEGYTNLALLTDGLRAEREQGITIDVAYRYFNTPKRKFIIADTPGHVQYTRNMVTGASTADLALILVDARHGIQEQSRRHAILTTMLRVPHVVLCVNKMDLVDYSQDVFDSIKTEFQDFAAKLEIGDLSFVPISALNGDNVVTRSDQHAVVRGRLAAAHAGGRAHRVRPQPDRLAVPGAVRHPPDERRPPRLPRLRRHGGRRRVQGGRRGHGAAVRASPPRIAAIDTFEGPIDEAFPPMSVTIRLEDEIDTSRGSMICRVRNQPSVGQDIDAMICWMDETQADPGRRPLHHQAHHADRPGDHQGSGLPAGRQLAAPQRAPRPAEPERDGPRHAAHHRAAVLRRVPPQPHHGQLHPHRRGHQLDRRCWDDPRRSVSADVPGPSSRNIVWQHGAVSREARPSRGATIWFTGFSGSGKSTIASAVEAALVAAGPTRRTCSTATTCATA